MILFSFPEFKYIENVLAKSLQIKKGQFILRRFPNQELFITTSTNVKDKDCLIVSTIAPPDESLIASLLLAHTLKKEGAKKLTLMLPYFAYSRQDKLKQKESLATDLMGKLMQSAGIDQVVTIDIHSQHVIDLFPISIKNITPIEIFINEINKLNWDKASLVAPDANSFKRCLEIKAQIRQNYPIVKLEKQRSLKGISHLSLEGKVEESAIIIDDMLDTGGTLISACQLLKTQKVKQIIIMVTHGLFTGEAWKELFKLNVETIYVTDTIPGVRSLASQRIKLLQIASLIYKQLFLHEKPRT